MIHHETIVAETAPEDSEEKGHWDVIEWPENEFPFQVFSRQASMPVAEFSRLESAVKDAEDRARQYDEDNAMQRGQAAVHAGGM